MTYDVRHLNTFPKFTNKNKTIRNTEVGAYIFL